MPNGDTILDNKVRRMLYNHIISYPGVSFNTLKNIFELTDSALRYHLHYLEKNGKISPKLDDGTRSYYPSHEIVTLPTKDHDVLAFQKLTPQQDKVLNVIMRYPGINQKGIIDRTRLDRFKVMKCIKTLKNLNLIKNRRVKNTVCYEYIPDMEMKYKILKGLIILFLKDEIDEATFIRLKKRLD